MTKPVTTWTQSSGADEELARLVEQITRKLQASEPVDLEQYASDHPEQADKLRRLLPTLQALGSLGRGDGGNGHEALDLNRDDLQVRTLGDFRILREIGRGGMGVVYEAVQISLGRTVALKVLPFAAMLDERQLKRFKNESRAAATLDHPNIVSVYSVGTERGVHYYAMQLIEGQSMAEVIEEMRQAQGETATAQGSSGARGRADRLDPTIDSAKVFRPWERGAKGDEAASEGFALGTDHVLSDTARAVQTALSTTGSNRTPEFFRAVARLGVQASEALDYAHQHGIVHRDVKPANLMLDARGILSVTDFGLAQIESDAGMTMTGDLIGTMRYMSPEQALTKRVVVDHRTDIYSLGVTLYELLTLQPAYSGKDRQALLTQIAFEEPKPPRRLNGRIPHELETIVLKTMAKNPEERYATAQDLADDLRRWQLHEPIRAKPPTPLQRAQKWFRRHRTWVRAAAVVLFVMLIGFAISTVVVSHERKEAVRQRNRAEANFRRAHQAIARYFAAVDQNELLAAPGLNSLREDLLKSALDAYIDFAKLRPDDPQIQAELAAIYFRLAWISMSIELQEDANASMLHGLEIVHSLMRRAVDESQWQGHLAGVFSHHRLFHKCSYRDPISARRCLATLEQTAELWETLTEAHPSMTAFRSDVANLNSVVGDIHLYIGEELVESDALRALSFYERAHGQWERLTDEAPNISDYRGRLDESTVDLAVLLMRAGQLEKGDALLRSRNASEQSSASAHGPVLNPANGHYYEFVDGDISWLDARAAAERRVLVDHAGNLLRGYLATVTSDEEQAFLAKEFVTRSPDLKCERVWLGGSDAQVEGQWRWVTGPEAFADQGKGLLFWVGNEEGTAHGYNNWFPRAEPNNILYASTDVGENYLGWNHRVFERRGFQCYWNDYENSATSARSKEPMRGYLVEYGGLGALASDAYMKALAKYETLIAEFPDRAAAHDWYASALLQAATGHLDEYRHTCRRMLKRFHRAQQSRRIPYSVQLACVVAPDALDDFSALVQAIRPTPRAGEYLILGAVFYRMGKLHAALLNLEKSSIAGDLANFSEISRAYLLAMTHYRLGNSEAAQQWLNAANELANNLVAIRPESLWTGRLMTYVLRDEARTMLADRSEELDVDFEVNRASKNQRVEQNSSE